MQRLERKIMNRRFYALARKLASVCRWLPGETGRGGARLDRIETMIRWADANGFALDEQEAMTPEALRAALQAMGEFDVSVHDDDPSWEQQS